MVNISESVLVALLLLYILSLIILTELLIKFKLTSEVNSRKLLHILSGNVVFFLFYLKTYWLSVLIPAGFIVVNYLMSPNSNLSSFKLKTFNAGHSYGTVYYAISLTILVVFGFDNKELILLSFLPLSYGDGLAALIGMKYPFKEITLYNGKKSLNGSLAFILGSFFSLFFSFQVLNILSYSVIYLLFISIFGLVLELISPRGTDNLVVPIGIFVTISWLLPFLISSFH